MASSYSKDYLRVSDWNEPEWFSKSTLQFIISSGCSRHHLHFLYRYQSDSKEVAWKSNPARWFHVPFRIHAYLLQRLQICGGATSVLSNWHALKMRLYSFFKIIIRLVKFSRVLLIILVLVLVVLALVVIITNNKCY